MISSIQLQSFKAHRDSTVPLGRFTALVGPNGSGKTSVLEALLIHSRLARHSVQDVLTGDWAFDDLVRRGAEESIVLALEGIQSTTAWSSRIAIARTSMTHDWTWGDSAKHIDVPRRHPLSVDVSEIEQILGPAALYKPDSGAIAAAAYSDDPGAGVEDDGTNTAVALSAIKLGQDEDFERIEESLRQIIPNVRRIRIRPARVRRGSERVVGSKIFFDFRGADGVPAHAVSEGTLITLALLTILHGPNRPRILLLDDLAQSLHPQAQMELVRLIKRMLTEIEDLQIVATTHSPYILDELDPAEILAFALRDDGTVALKHLSDHPQAARMKGALTAGQLWSLDPERDWVLAEGGA